MSRSGYSDDLDSWALIRWRGQVASAIRGRRGQAVLRDLLAALDAMPEKALVASELETPQGEVCVHSGHSAVRVALTCSPWTLKSPRPSPHCSTLHHSSPKRSST